MMSTFLCAPSGKAEVRVWYKQSPNDDPLPDVRSVKFTAFTSSSGALDNPLDANRDGIVSAIDALMIINELTSASSRLTNGPISSGTNAAKKSSDAVGQFSADWGM